MYTHALIKPHPVFPKDLQVIVGLSLFLLIIHLFDNLWVQYGIFRDEYYYLACANHLSWGYVDHPPFCVFVLAVVRFFIGDSLFALRLVPALALSFTVFFNGLTVRVMGGGIVAIALSAVAIMVGPIFLAMGSYYSMNSLDIMFWSIAGYLLVCISQQGEKKYWIWLGVLLGIGLLNKISILWLGFGLLAGLLFTLQRKALLTPWPYIAGGIALLLFLPYIIWNFTHDFAQIEFMQNAVKYKYNGITRMDFVMEQFLTVMPIVAILTFSGLYFFFFDSQGKTYRMLGIIFISTFLILLINGHSKSEYMAPPYPLIYTGGSVLLARLMSSKWKWSVYVLLVLLISGGIVLSPIVLTVLPVQDFISYSQKIGITPGNSEGKELAELPQFYADRFGWESMAEDVSKVYQSLPDEEQKHTVVFANNYGDAASVEYYSNIYPVPPVMSGHNAYWTWGPPAIYFSTVIVIGGNPQDHQKSFKDVKQVAVHRAKYAMPYETNLPIFVCRQLRFSKEQVWPAVKHYD